MHGAVLDTIWVRVAFPYITLYQHSYLPPPSFVTTRGNRYLQQPMACVAGKSPGAYNGHRFGQVLSILHIIGADFGLNDQPGQLSWFAASYSLTVGTFILLAGRFGDLFGYKKMLIIGFSWFTVWSMIAGLAVYSNHVLFNFARVFQGVGPAILLPNALALLGSTYPPGWKKNMCTFLFLFEMLMSLTHQIPSICSVWSLCAFVCILILFTCPGLTISTRGSLIGATMAAVLALAWWPWAFWAQSLALAVVTVLGIFVIPNPPRQMARTSSLRETLVELDLFAGSMGVTALILFNFAWNQAPIVGWSEPYIYVILILSFLFGGAFVFFEARSEHPLIPFKALNADVAFVLACVGCGWANFGIWYVLGAVPWAQRKLSR